MNLFTAILSINYENRPDLNILKNIHTSITIRRYARVLLALFVLSVLNMSVQVPAHAAMKMQMQMQSSDMQEMSDCHCPPALCDSVLALENQSVDGLVAIPSYNYRSSDLYEILALNTGMLNQKQHVDQLYLNVSQAAPPTLLIKTLLTI